MITTIHRAMLNFRHLGLLALAIFGVVGISVAQCPTGAAVISKTHTNISCFNANDGTITVELGNGAAPLNFELYDNNLGTFVTLSVTEAEDPDGNGNFRKVKYTNVYASSFQVVVFKTGCPPLSITEGLGTVVSEPTVLSATQSSTVDCDPTAGIGNGSIDLTPSGGTAPYSFLWADGPASEDRSALDAGNYSVDITDANGCSINLNFTIPGFTQADAGAATGLACGTNNFALSANAPAINETGTWTGPPGVTFTPNASDRNATAGNLGAGANVLTWTISDDNAICASTFDNITVTFSPAITLTSTVINVLCKGASTGSIDLAVSGGLGPFTYLWSDGSLSEDLANIPAGTYSVTVTDAATCTASLNNITVTEPASAVSGTPSTVDVLCFGASTGSIAITGTGGVGPYDFSMDGGATYPVLAAANTTFSGLPAGTFNVKVRDANACESPLIPVTINQPPTAVGGTTTQVDVLCFGASTGSIAITGSGGVGPYDFSIDGGTTYPVTDVANHTFPGLAAGPYNLKVRDANGCESGAIAITITEPAATVGGTTTQVDVLCFGTNTGSISITGIGGAGPYDFSKDGGATYTELDGANANFPALSAGAYSLKVRDNNGCESPVIPITIAQPAAAVGGTTTQIDVACFGASTGSISITGTGGVGPYDFSIDGGTTYLILDAANHNFPNLSAGAYSLKVRDANNCESASIPVTITEPAAVDGTFTTVDVACFGASTGSITITGIGGVGPYDFSIDAGGSYPVLAAPTNTFPGLAAGAYSLKVRDASGCESAIIPVTINQPAAAASGSTTQIDATCFGASTGSITIIGAGGVSPYDFSIDGGTTYAFSGAPNATFSSLAAGPYNLKVRDANGCESANIPVVINQPPAAVGGTTSQVDISCFGASSGSITITGTGGVGPYDFSIDGGATYAALALPAKTFNSLPAGAYSLKVRDANGCESGLLPVTLTEPAAATGGTTSKTDLSCFGNASGSISITGTGGVAPYDFSIDGGATYSVAGAPNATFPALAAATYNLKVRDANGCESPLIPVVISQPAEVTAVVTANGPVVVCAGSTLPDIVFTFTGVAPFDFTYSDGTTPVAVNDHPTTTFTLPSAAPGTYSVTALTDDSGCTSSSLGGSVTVVVQPAATVEAGNPQSICSGAMATLTGSSVGGSATTGAWTIIIQPVGGDGLLSNLAQTATPDAVTFTATVAGSYTLRLTTDDPPSLCDAVADDVVVTVTSAPTVDAGAPLTICSSGTATLAGAFTGSTGITWTTSGDGSFNDATLTNAVYTPGSNDKANGAVTLTLTTAGPCASVNDNVVITINPDPTVDAGAPQTVCSSASVTLNGVSGGSATGLLWTTSGNGTFDDSTDPFATYTLGAADITNGSVVLTATATGSCAGTADNVTITINPAATVDAGTPQTICLGSPVILDGTMGGSATTVTWTSSGDGSFNNANDPDAHYTPGVNDQTNGAVTLTLTTNNPPGVCAAATDNVVISFMPIPGDQTTAGAETWIGYVYDDSGDPTPIPARIDFNNAKYRGFINATDIDNMSGTSTYNVTTDEFDLNPGLALPIQGANVCGTYLDAFSVRYKMAKTFAAGVYRFTAGADDGVKLLIDGVNVLPVSAFDFQSYTTYTSSPLCISAGVHQIEIQYFENNAQSRLTFTYAEVAPLTTTSPVAVCMNDAAPALLAASSDPDVANFNWYKNGTLVFTGPAYTPGAAELDMTTAGNTTFNVTSVFGCGETQPTPVVVNVVNSATLTILPQTICESAGPVDLRTLVTESPAGGAFVFSGHPNIAGNNFDPASLAGTTVSISVDYSIGSCSAATGTLDLTISNSATTTVPASPVAVCESAPDIDLTGLVSAVPAGGSFTFAGAQVTGSMFNPSGLSGLQTITVDYSMGGCAASQETFQVDVKATASLTTTDISTCETGSLVNLLGLVSGTPAGGAFIFTGAGVSGSTFNPSGQSGAVMITADYDANGCTANGAIQITVLGASDPICTGGNCSSVVIVPQPQPATCTNSDGKIVFSINPPVPVINNTGIKITIDGISSTNLAISRTNFNNTTFNALPVGTYNYSIEYGDPSCLKTGTVTIDQSGTVAAPVASNIIGPTCPGSATGSVTLSVPGEAGNILEWSLDGGLTDPFKPFTAGGQITGIPAGPAPTFEQVISVRRNISDPCYAAVTIVMQETVSAISATFSTTAATCNGNDGGITNIVAGGGNGAPYTFSVNGGASFQAQPNFNGLAGGSYTLRVRDAGGCEKDFAADVMFPGFINSIITKNDADCTNNGNSGSISVRIDDPGVFEVALTTDPLNAPADSLYHPYSNPSIAFDNLPRGQYFIYIRSTGNGCPTHSAPIDIFGVYVVDFDIVPDCQSNGLSIALVNVKGDPNGAPVEIHVTRKLSADPPEIIYKQFPADGEIYLDHDLYAFLKTPAEYRITLFQFQDDVVCNLASETLDIDVPQPLAAQVGAVSKSFPDIATGTLNITAFSGGINPYQVKIDLDSAASFALPQYTTNFETAGLDNNLDFQMAYEKVPAGRYQVQVVDSLGCTITLTARVPLDEDLFVPNVFTPNGDGSNDVFFIRNLPSEPSINELIISNRWGKEVFISENYQNNWDAANVADGIYFYRLKIQGGDPITGWVEIMRGPKP